MTTAPPAGSTPAAPPRASTSLFAPAPTSSARPEAPPLPPVRRAPLVVSGLLAAALTAYVWSAHGAKPGVLLLLGLGLGVALFHSRFGFTSAWRQLVAVGNGAGLRAHALLLGTTATLFALLIGTGTGLFGSQPTPSAGPIGVGLFAGSALFAIGMQLGGACASGTLFAVGSGQTSIVLTLGGFVAGATLAAWQFDLWKDLPAWEPVVLSDHIMIGAAVAAAVGGTWALHRGIPWRTAVAAVLGGVLMGIGARLAGGCNIGAYLAGIASGSLSGWLWGAFALAGTWVGLRLRPLFGLGNPKPGDGVC
ncbi:YeeE/YedE thiosulfate transporter family protein [Streptomyces sp. NPDC058534]|uniref:YeeE/YedE thiosulfate transporter family protein n=1 Tax=Streptomyces sp. NPDC058534 TaxID=3346541 RepID=UPI0036668A3C